MDDHGLFVWILTCLLLVSTHYHYVCGLKLTILHTNDLHARIEEMNKYNGRCSSSNADEGKCYGGVERLKSMISELREAHPDSLLLDAGDQYQGTLFFYVHGGQMLSHFMNVLGYDVMALGNHEFDKGPSGLEPFVDNATFSIVSSNADTSATPNLAAVQKSVVIEVSGESVGVIGYTTSETPIISKPENVKFKDELESIQAEVDVLSKLGVNKIIALGHAGYAKDTEIASKVRGVDVVVGGHSNTFLYTGAAPANEEPLGVYPTVVRNQDGRDVLVVQGYAYGKYLGFLQVDFDDNGVVTSWSGNPILMDNTVPKDPGITDIIATYSPEVEQVKGQKAGQSLVRLQGDRRVCRVRECNLGNMMTDSMVRQNLRYADSVEWNHVGIALLNSGSIRASISKGDIMTSDVLNVAPFGNTVDIAELTGRILWEVLEHSAAAWTETGTNGAFLQFSGLRVVYDIQQKVGRRVVTAHALCADCDIPEFKPLNLTKSYKVLMSSYIVGGGDGYSVVRDNVGSTHTIGDLDSQLLLDYLSENSPVTHGLEGRIQFLQDVKKAGYCVGGGAPVISKSQSSFLLLVTNIIAFTIVISWTL